MKPTILAKRMLEKEVHVYVYTIGQRLSQAQIKHFISVKKDLIEKEQVTCTCLNIIQKTTYIRTNSNLTVAY